MKCSILVALSLFAGSALASSSHSSSDLDHTKRFDKVLRATPEGEIDGGLAVRDGPEKMGLAKRATNGRMSFFAPGLGACGSYSNAGDFMVAMNGAQYGNMGAISDWCFQTITISYGGRSHTATVLDACPGCPYGGLDLSPALFNYFADPSVGIIYASWTSGRNEPEPEPEPTTSRWVEPTTTTSRWVAPTTRSTSEWVEPTTSSTTTTTATTTRRTTTSASPSTPSSLISSSSLANNGTRNSTATASAILPGASTSVAVSELVGGNLDDLVQVVLALGSLAGAAAQAQSA